MAKRLKSRPKDPEDTKGGVRGTHGLGDAPRDPKLHRVATPGGAARVLPEEEGEVDASERDAEAEQEERYARGLETVKTPGPGPNDRDAGTAAARHLDAHGLRKKV